MCGLFERAMSKGFISPESRQAFWIGFALLGWTYLGFSLVPSIESRLMTTKAFAYLDSQLPERSPAVYTIQLAGTGSGSAGNQVKGINIMYFGSCASRPLPTVQPPG